MKLAFSWNFHQTLRSRQISKLPKIFFCVDQKWVRRSKNTFYIIKKSKASIKKNKRKKTCRSEMQKWHAAGAANATRNAQHTQHAHATRNTHTKRATRTRNTQHARIIQNRHFKGWNFCRKFLTNWTAIKNSTHHSQIALWVAAKPWKSTCNQISSF